MRVRTRSGEASPSVRARGTALMVGVVAALAVATPASAASPILLDQTGPASTGLISQMDTGGTRSDLDSQTADDFTVPAGSTWTIDGVEVRSSYSGARDAAVNVDIYSDASGLPGASVYSQADGASSNAPNYQIPLVVPAVLPAGKYWLSVQVKDDFNQTYWYWDSLDAGPGHDKLAFRNPNNGFNTGCTNWSDATSCIYPGYPQDQSFLLRGTDGPAVTDTTAPVCTVTGTVDGPPKQQTVSVTDAGSGVASIMGVKVSNGVVSVAPFLSGAASVTLTTTKTDQAVTTVYRFTATDVAGNSTLCQ